MNIDFKNKNILITGASGGLGEEMLKFFSNYQCKIYATTTNKKIILNKNKKKNTKTKFFYLNFNIDSSIKNFINELNKVSQIDILINNAGINKINSIDKIKINEWDDILRTNLTGSFILTKEVSKLMIKKRSGRILNISSIFGSVGKEKRSSYSSSKWGLVGLTKSSSLDLAKYNILVNALSPGVINSKLTKKILGVKGIDKIKKNIPLNRLAKKEEIVKAIAFLVSENNTYITGQNIIIDGGYTCG